MTINARDGTPISTDDPASTRTATLTEQTGTLHLIGHAHIDPVWLWQWPEGFAEIRHTWRSALDRMNEYEEFRFSASSAAFYAWIEQIDPGMFEEIRARVAEGRWEPVAGWWVEPDCTIPSGESFVRQALQGQRFFQSRFGRPARVGFNPDAFGHAAGLPQILARSGLAFYAFLRPQPHENPAIPRLFRWRALDGSEVVAFHIVHEYGAWTPELERWIRRCMTELEQMPDDTLMVFYGVGNHGGGPTRANLDSLRRLDDEPTIPRLERSTMGAFFDAVAATNSDLPVVSGELGPHAPGCYSANSQVKRWNRDAENLLSTAERWSVVARHLAGRGVPADELGRAWRNVLFNQFHDILAGTAIEPAYDDARDSYGEAMAIASRALNAGLQAVAARLDTGALPPATRAIVCFNPHPWPVETAVEMEIGGGPAGARGLPRDALLDDSGAPVAHQFVRSRATVTGGRARITFSAALPALGYRVYQLGTGSDTAGAGTAGVEPSTAAAHDRTVEATDTLLDNGHIRVEIDRRTGRLARLVDQETDADLFAAGGGAVAEVFVDGYDTWAHGLDRWTQSDGEFELVSTRLVEHGPVVSVISVERRFHDSTLIEEIRLSPGSDRVEVRCTLDWRERHRVLKLRFPLALADAVATFEAAHGEVMRATNGHEGPGQRWVDVSGAGPGNAHVGLALLNDGKHGFDVLDSTLAMTVVRSPLYAHHEPYLPGPAERATFQDQGVQRFRYALMPHGRERNAAAVRRAAAELHQPVIPLEESLHPGTLPMRASFASVSPETVEIVALKGWEDDPDGHVVVRLLETTGRGCEAAVSLPLLVREFSVAMDPWQLRTFVVPADPAAAVRETDAVEWPLETEPPRVEVR